MLEGVPCIKQDGRIVFQDGCVRTACANIVKHYSGPITKETVGWLNGRRLDENVRFDEKEIG